LRWGSGESEESVGGSEEILSPQPRGRAKHCLEENILPSSVFPLSLIQGKEQALVRLGVGRKKRRKKS
jgi:hypothetical protein